MSETILTNIDNKLAMIIKLLSLNAVKGRPFTEQVELLHNVGMAPVEIATILGKTANHIRVEIHHIKSKSKSRTEVDK